MIIEVLVKAVTTAIITYLFGNLCKFFGSVIHEEWIAEKESDTIQNLPESVNQSPEYLFLPSRDDMEAMYGDLLEWQDELRNEGVPTYRIILLTSWYVYHLICDVAEMTVHNLFVPNPCRTPKPPSKVSGSEGGAESVDDDNESPQI